MSNDITKLNILGIKEIIKNFASLISHIVFLFFSAGTFYWVRGWIYACLIISYLILYIAILLFINPQLLNERGKFSWKETKRYDKYFAIFYSILAFSMVIIAGLDAVRFQWSSIPIITIYPSIIVYILCCYLAFWANSSFAHLLVTYRDDKLSNQQVCTIGPYKYVRHPAYLSMIIASICYPFIIGSLLSFIPVFINIILFIIRTYYEDKTLKLEFNGYEDYSKTTKFRLFPYIW